MAIQKPQKPLMVNSQEIYPLTAAEQVVMDDGSRFNAYVEKFIVPSYTSDDFGKMLTCTASGLKWVESLSELDNAEVGSF